jgi:hypothetical protein
MCVEQVSLEFSEKYSTWNNIGQAIFGSWQTVKEPGLPWSELQEGFAHFSCIIHFKRKNFIYLVSGVYIKFFIMEWFYYKRKCWKLLLMFHVFLHIFIPISVKYIFILRFYHSVSFMYMKPITIFPHLHLLLFTLPLPQEPSYTVPILQSCLSLLIPKSMFKGVSRSASHLLRWHLKVSAVK